MEKSKVFWTVVFFTIALGFYTHKLTTAYYVDTDFARDIFRIWEIAKGDVALIGPPLSIGAFAGPFYYYLQIPLLVFTAFNEAVLLYFNAALFAVGSALAFRIISTRYSTLRSALAAASIAGMPFWINAARRPGNAFTYLPILLLITLLIVFKIKFSKLNLLLLGILSGIVLNFHPVAIYALVPTATILLIKLKPKKLFMLFVATVVLTYTPLAAFEVKSGFIISKNVFVNTQYRDTKQLAPTIYHITAKQNPWENLAFMISKTKDQLRFTVPWLWLLCLPLLLMAKKRHDILLSLWGIGSFLLVVVTARFLFEPHYLLPSLVLSSITLAILLARISPWFGTIWLVGLITVFPGKLYTPSPRSLQKFATISESLIQQGVVHKGDLYNVVELVEENHYVPAGHMYRYNFAKQGMLPLGLVDYPESDYLLIFSEIKNLDLDRLSFWEIDQFDKSTREEFKIANQPTQIFRLTSATD